MLPSPTDFTSYPPTEEGVQNLVKDLTPTLVSLWKAERNVKTDDVVAVIDVGTNEVSLSSRSKACQQIKKHKYSSDLLEHLQNPVYATAGSITICAIVGFPEGQVATVPVVLARS